MLSRRRLVCDSITILLVLLSFSVLARTTFRPKRFGDRDFHVEAKALAAAVRGAEDWNNVHLRKAPGPVFYYFIPYLSVAPGSNDDAYWTRGFIWTVLWVCVAMVLLRRTGETLGGPGVGWLTVAFSLAPPFVVYYAFGVDAEVPAFVGVALFGCGWVAWLKQRERRLFGLSWWLSWLGLSVALLCRPNLVLALPIAAICAVISWHAKGAEALARTASIAAGLLVPVALAGLSWVVIQKLEGGWQKGNLAHVVLQGRFQYRNEPWDWRYWGKDYRQGSKDFADWKQVSMELEQQARQSGEALSTVQWRWIKDDIVSSPMLSLRMSAIRLLTLNVVFANGPGGGEFGLRTGRRQLAFLLFHLIANLAYAGSVVLALVYLLKRPEAAIELWPLWTCWAALLAFHVFTYAEPRYLFPGRAGMAVLAALTVGELAGARRSAPLRAPT